MEHSHTVEDLAPASIRGSPHCNERLRQSSEPLAHDLGAGEQAAQGGGVKQADVAEVVLDVELPAVGGGALDERPDGEVSGDAALPSGSQEVEERGEQVRLDGERAVGGLHPIRTADAGDLVSKFLLALETADVLDHGVAEDDVEGAVG